jgi:pyruvate formate lyase activating enzyme
MSGIVFDIQTYALYDGPGIRTTVFFKGCPLRCAWCHNPESWKTEPEMGRLDDKRTMIGEKMSVEEVLARVLPDKPFYETSGGGVTFTGGEPTMQPEFLLACLAALQDKKLNTAIETCGLFPESLCEKLADVVDLFLFDIKLIDDVRHKELAGTSNRKILENFRTLIAKVAAGRIVPRVPLIPTVNTDEQTIDAIAAFLRDAGYDGPVHLMPYNRLAKSKWEKVGLNDRYRDFGEFTDGDLDAVLKRFERTGFRCMVNQ